MVCLAPEMVPGWAQGARVLVKEVPPTHKGEAAPHLPRLERSASG